MAENWLDQTLIVCNAIINPDHILFMDQYSDNIRNPQNEWFEISYKNQLKNIANTYWQINIFELPMIVIKNEEKSLTFYDFK